MENEYFIVIKKKYGKFNYFTFLTVYFPTFEYYDVSFSNRTFKDLLFRIKNGYQPHRVIDENKFPAIRESPFPFTLKEAKETVKLLKVYSIVEKLEFPGEYREYSFYIVNFKTHKKIKC